MVEYVWSSRVPAVRHVGACLFVQPLRLVKCSGPTVVMNFGPGLVG